MPEFTTKDSKVSSDNPHTQEYDLTPHDLIMVETSDETLISIPIESSSYDEYLVIRDEQQQLQRRIMSLRRTIEARREETNQMLQTAIRQISAERSANQNSVPHVVFPVELVELLNRVGERIGRRIDISIEPENQNNDIDQVLAILRCLVRDVSA